MPQIAYTVTATLPDEPTARRYLEWLQSGHIQAVVRGGADSSQIVRLDEPAAPIRVQTVYEFPSREAFDAYLEHHAPALRADGVAQFGSTAGVRFERTIGSILDRHPTR